MASSFLCYLVVCYLFAFVFSIILQNLKCLRRILQQALVFTFEVSHIFMLDHHSKIRKSLSPLLQFCSKITFFVLLFMS